MGSHAMSAKVLIIEDEWLIRTELRNMLQQYSFIEEIAEAGSMHEAIQKTEAFAPDVIFLDIQLPDGTGFDFLQRFHTTSEVVFITAFDQYQERAKNYKPLAYLMKPIHNSKLRKVMQAIKEIHYEKNEC